MRLRFNGTFHTGRYPVCCVVRMPSDVLETRRNTETRIYRYIPRTNNIGRMLRITMISPCRRFLTRRSQQHRFASSTQSTQSNYHDVLWLPSMVTRLAAALGMIHIVSEYGIQLVLCEGPSMMPTIQPRGEIILVHRLHLLPVRWEFPDGRVRAQQAREQQTNSTTDQWHHVLLPVNHYRQQQHTTTTIGSCSWWKQFTSPMSVGDVVVVQHPDKAGTVCKRIMGLPGDMILSPPTRMKQLPLLNQRRHPQILVIPNGHMWLEGDNPMNSNDSRDYGPIPQALVVGRVLCRVWPLRTDMWMRRGLRPTTSRHNNTHIILPAGYEGESLA